MSTSLSTLRNVTLGLAHYHAKRYVVAELAFYRRAIAWTHGGPTAVRRLALTRLSDARKSARAFNDLLTLDIRDLILLGLSYEGFVITEAIKVKVRDGRHALAQAEVAAGFPTPTSGLACGSDVPWARSGAH